MRGIAQILPLVMGVIIAGSLLVIGFKILGKASGGVESLWGMGESFQQRYLSAQSLASSCEDWLYGDRYNARAILEVYKIPDKMRPYRDLWYKCGEPLLEIAQECYTRKESYGKCAGNGYINADEYELIICAKICRNIIKIYDTCRVSCEDNLPNCFEYLIQNAGVDQDQLWITPSMVEKACE